MKNTFFAVCVGIVSIASVSVRAQDAFVPSPPMQLEASDDDFHFGKSTLEPAEVARGDAVTLEENSPSDSGLAAGGLPEPRSLNVSANRSDASIAGVPHVQDSLISWSDFNRRKSLGLKILLRDDCNAAALWAGYPAQRAAECERMWAKLNRPSACQSCISACGCSSGCGSRSFNRYKSSPSSCDQCATCSAVSSPAISTGRFPSRLASSPAAQGRDCPEPREPIANAQQAIGAPTNSSAQGSATNYNVAAVPVQQPIALPVGYQR